jgi:hypothetical protein
LIQKIQKVATTIREAVNGMGRIMATNMLNLYHSRSQKVEHFKAVNIR